ncbi:MAG: helix-turn-helix transcriptional regulator [Burkholderiaceae bacterium]|nr:helix-turn-helix transcriptional regulator [Microbacteriaceae bacterium]
MAIRKYDAPALGRDALRALGHPLRLKIYRSLMNDGPSTATVLARATGQSTGDTSYHLRQLASHGLVEDAVGLGTGRERWWRVDPAGFSVDPLRAIDPDTSAAVALLVDEAGQQRALDLARWAGRIADEPESWVTASVSTRETLVLRADRLALLVEEVRGVIDRFREEAAAEKDGTKTDMRQITVYFDAFPAAAAE